MKAPGQRTAAQAERRRREAAPQVATSRPAAGGECANAHVLTLALPRGRILDEALPLFARAGIDLGAAEKARAGRRLIIPIPEHDLRVLIVRDTDVPAYVEHGAADLGIAGRDVLDEQDARSLRAARSRDRPLPHGRRRARRIAPSTRPRRCPPALRHQVPRDHAAATCRRAASSPRSSSSTARSRSRRWSGLADRIVDLVSSGETLRQHHLREVETILEVSARLCVGRAAAKLHGDRIDDLVGRLRQAVASR